MDWAALAKQWIAQKEAVGTIQQPPPQEMGPGPGPGPPPPPPPEGDGGQGDSMDICTDGNTEHKQNNGGECEMIFINTILCIIEQVDIQNSANLR